MTAQEPQLPAIPKIPTQARRLSDSSISRICIAPRPLCDVRA